ncbi:hypothetical protein, partial [Mesorhizobium sp.]|uniref:hypothetical protein n=2 Tax=Mesorhizobium sp. TaxID=1871066 RepID=UPI0025EC59A3
SPLIWESPFDSASLHPALSHHERDRPRAVVEYSANGMQKIDFSSPKRASDASGSSSPSWILGLRAHPQPDRGHMSVRADVLRRAATTTMG